jgi:hypothetical protein
MHVITKRAIWLGLLVGSSATVALAAFAVAKFSDKADAELARARFTPSEETVRHVLTAALRSWQKGEKPGPLSGAGNPSIILVDECRRPEQTLERFTILGEAPGDGPRCFAVRVHLKNPDEEQRLRFVVFGIDPIWVCRYEDYEMMMHWECGREEREVREASSRKSKE